MATVPARLQVPKSPLPAAQYGRRPGRSFDSGNDSARAAKGEMKHSPVRWLENMKVLVDVNDSNDD